MTTIIIILLIIAYVSDLIDKAAKVSLCISFALILYTWQTDHTIISFIFAALTLISRLWYHGFRCKADDKQ